MFIKTTAVFVDLPLSRLFWTTNAGRRFAASRILPRRPVRANYGSSLSLRAAGRGRSGV